MSHVKISGHCVSVLGSGGRKKVFKMPFFFFFFLLLEPSLKTQEKMKERRPLAASAVSPMCCSPDPAQFIG